MCRVQVQKVDGQAQQGATHLPTTRSGGPVSSQPPLLQKTALGGGAKTCLRTCAWRRTMPTMQGQPRPGTDGQGVGGPPLIGGGTASGLFLLRRAPDPHGIRLTLVSETGRDHLLAWRPLSHPASRWPFS